MRGTRTEKAWHEKIKKRPQLKNIVLDRCARQNQAVVGLHCFGCLGNLGFRIFDDMTLRAQHVFR